MAKNLVIVESPAKARTLQKYLGSDYQIKASVGHVVDLPKNSLGVDIAQDFKPDYKVIQGKSKIIEEIRQAAKQKEKIYLASDPDREGEAIAWHIAQRIGRKDNLYRVLFNEITRRGVLEAIRSPQSLDQNKFEAQQARRILDRLVGYQISPILWKKVRRGLSAGRVQSVAVRIICEREREIQKFAPLEYWSLTAKLEGTEPPPFQARLFSVDGERLDAKKFRIATEAEMVRILQDLEGASWVVSRVETRERRRNPAPPFITSRLQQEASRKLGFQPSRTMAVAQRLYEGADLGAEGSVGLITYMRTDSTRIADDALESVRAYIRARFGPDYLPEKPQVYRSRKSAQDAHEAIRPTSIEYPPEKVEPFLRKDELSLYTLIWNRFVSSQMEPALFDQTVVDIELGRFVFRTTGQVLKFDGFTRIYTEGRDDEDSGEDEGGREIPKVQMGERLNLIGLNREQHFTEPPPRFTQSTLIKELEENGIGRPSTYASIVSNILNREYVVEDQQKRLVPTELGFLVTSLLVEAFPDLMSVDFTAGMEEVLDRIEEGSEDWLVAMKRFYQGFSDSLGRAEETMDKVKQEDLQTEITCEKCKARMTIRWGKNGEFLACPNYPRCRYTMNFTRDDKGGIQVQQDQEEENGEVCEKCGEPMKIRWGKYGRFLGCSGYPKCKNIKNIKSMEVPRALGISCPVCGAGSVVERKTKRGKLFYGCNRFPECTFASWDRPVGEACPRCGGTYLVEKVSKRLGARRVCPEKSCDYQETAEALVP
jgi:DNA topoisomerase-1